MEVATTVLEYAPLIDPLQAERGGTKGFREWFDWRPHRAVWLVAFALLAVAQVIFAGYELGAGNQTIQIPFLRHWQDPTLFANDPVIRTAADYPTWFFRLLALVVPGQAAGGVPTAYFFLHLLTACAVLAAMAGLTRAMFGDRLSGGIVVLMLWAGHHRALGGDEFYSTGFTHTWAVFPLAIGAMLLFYRERLWAAFALAGVLFNLHALTAAYLVVFFTTWGGWEALRGRIAWRRLLGLMGLFVLLALPTVALMVGRHQTFGAEWVRLTRIRSADHSFPSSWWVAGAADVPRFLLITALAALSLSFVGDVKVRRKSLAIAGATALLFVVGVAFCEIWPWPAVMRAQVFRASRLFMVVAFAHVAYGIAGCLRAREVVGVLGILVLIVLAVPTQAAQLPWVVLLATAAALGFGRLSAGQAVAASGAMLVSLVAWRTIRFPLAHGLADLPAMSAGVRAALVGGTMLWAISWLRVGRWTRGVVIITGLIGVTVVTHHLYATAGPGEIERDPWVQMQLWARERTPVDAVFLTPPLPGGFRIFSDRAVVAEWRDGTQAYFTAAFARDWWERMTRVQQRLQYDSSGQNLLIKGRALETYEDDELIALCNRPEIAATRIVLPNTGKRRNLVREYQNAAYSIYLPQIEEAAIPDDAPDKDRWAAQEQFVRETCLPNIEKYRKGDLRVTIVDELGAPVAGLPVRLNQTRHAFGFGCSLPFFKRPDTMRIESFMPQTVDPRELTAFRELFNYSQIGFSGKWGYIEINEGKRDYTDLEMYLDFCRESRATPEFHFLSGYLPTWARRHPRAELAARFLEHSKDLVTRYGGQIPYWQVVNEQMLLEYSPPVFEAIRKINPDLKLGISHCAQFWSQSRDPRHADMYRGLEDLRWLKSKGVKVDYFAFHGHRPMGVWPDARDMYEALDTFAKEGVKIHVSEFTVPQNQPISGPVRSGRWTDELQAEYYERFYTVCFSHPEVEVINMWGIGPVTWQDGSGLLDAKYEHKAAFEVLRNLFQTRWHTELSGTLASDGAIAGRAFYGEYEVTVNLPDARTARAVVSFDKAGDVRLKLDRAAGTLAKI